MVIIMISLIRMMIRMQMVAAESTMMIMKVMCVCYDDDDDDDSAQKHRSEKSTRVQNSHLCSLCMHERKNDLHICTGREDRRGKKK